MIDHDNVPSVGSDELLARYLVQRNQIRGSDQSVKPDAFLPPPGGELSVTRHLSATEEEIWQVGRDVAAQRAKTLRGRADIVASTCIAQELGVVAAPIEDNPNHAHVSGWPADKPSQKIIAQEIAAAAAFKAVVKDSTQ